MNGYSRELIKNPTKFKKKITSVGSWRINNISSLEHNLWPKHNQIFINTVLFEAAFINAACPGWILTVFSTALTIASALAPSWSSTLTIDQIYRIWKYQILRLLRKVWKVGLISQTEQAKWSKHWVVYESNYNKRYNGGLTIAHFVSDEPKPQSLMWQWMGLGCMEGLSTEKNLSLWHLKCIVSKQIMAIHQFPESASNRDKLDLYPYSYPLDKRCGKGYIGHSHIIWLIWVLKYWIHNNVCSPI